MIRRFRRNLMVPPRQLRGLGLFAAALVLAGVTALAAPVLAQSPNEVGPLIDTVNRLERQLQALERTVYKGGGTPAPGVSTAAEAAPVDNTPPPPTAVAQLQLKTSQIEDQLRDLTGRVEEVGFQVRQLTERLERLVADVDFRLQALERPGSQPLADAPGSRVKAPPPTAPRAAPVEGRVTINQPGKPGPVGVFGTLTEDQMRAAGVEPGEAAQGQQDDSVQSAAAPVAAQSVLPEGTPQERYDFARAFLMRRDFDGAEQALGEFVAAHPEDALAGNAQYWLGETHYVRKEYETAARAFAQGFQDYPDSGKAPDNLLKLGLSLAALERTDDACITLQKLKAEYPKAPATILQRADREASRLKCK